MLGKKSHDDDDDKPNAAQKSTGKSNSPSNPNSPSVSNTPVQAGDTVVFHKDPNVATAATVQHVIGHDGILRLMSKDGVQEDIEHCSSGKPSCWYLRDKNEQIELPQKDTGAVVVL